MDEGEGEGGHADRVEPAKRNLQSEGRLSRIESRLDGLEAR
jgi:hypothetical protein